MVKTVDLTILYEAEETYGITHDLLSCYTGIIDGNVLEDHVPEDDVSQRLKEKLEGIGLSQNAHQSSRNRVHLSENYSVMSFNEEEKIDNPHTY